MRRALAEGKTVRGLPLALALLLAGCALAPPPPPETGETPTPATGPPAAPACAELRVELGTETIVLWQPWGARARVTNCGATLLALERSDLCANTGLRLTLERDGQAWRPLGGLSAVDAAVAERSCADAPRDGAHLLPGGSVTEALRWNGTRLTPEGNEPLALGEYALVVRARDLLGHEWEERARVLLAPPAVPPADEHAEVVLLVEERYAQGDVAVVRVRNDGASTYAISIVGGGCALAAYTDAGRPLRAPGLQCARVGEPRLAPGEEAVLAEWALDECVGPGECRSLAPLAPGTYHLRGTFAPVDDAGVVRHGDATTAGAALRVD